MSKSTLSFVSACTGIVSPCVVAVRGADLVAAESTVGQSTLRETDGQNSRVKWWAIVQVGILLSTCAWNVHYLKSWFEVKRVL